MFPLAENHDLLFQRDQVYSNLPAYELPLVPVLSRLPVVIIAISLAHTKKSMRWSPRSFHIATGIATPRSEQDHLPLEGVKHCISLSGQHEVPYHPEQNLPSTDDDR